jgi:hypothetical protein
MHSTWQIVRGKFSQSVGMVGGISILRRNFDQIYGHSLLFNLFSRIDPDFGHLSTDISLFYLVHERQNCFHDIRTRMYFSQIFKRSTSKKFTVCSEFNDISLCLL